MSTFDAEYLRDDSWQTAHGLSVEDEDHGSCAPALMRLCRRWALAPLPRGPFLVVANESFADWLATQGVEAQHGLGDSADKYTGVIADLDWEVRARLNRTTPLVAVLARGGKLLVASSHRRSHWPPAFSTAALRREVHHRASEPLLIARSELASAWLIVRNPVA